MALIADYPGNVATAPVASVMNQAAKSFVEQIGGVLPDGTIFPGNLDATNLLTVSYFRNEQKLEPYDEFAVSAHSTDVNGFSAFPCDVALVGLAYHGDVAHKGTITFREGGVDLYSFSFDDTNTDVQWPMSGLIPAGTPLSAAVVYNPASADAWVVTLFVKALSRSGW